MHLCEFSVPAVSIARMLYGCWAGLHACNCESVHGVCCVEMLTALMQMFARELAADWTSWGNEVLRFQTLDRFDLKMENC